MAYLIASKGDVGSNQNDEEEDELRKAVQTFNDVLKGISEREKEEVLSADAFLMLPAEKDVEDALTDADIVAQVMETETGAAIDEDDDDVEEIPRTLSLVEKEKAFQLLSALTDQGILDPSGSLSNNISHLRDHLQKERAARQKQSNLAAYFHSSSSSFLPTVSHH